MKINLNIGEQFPQGDLLIERIDKIPEGITLNPTKKELVAEGEASGHNHVLVADGPKTKLMFSKAEDGKMYFQFTETATLGHWIGDTKQKADHEALTFTQPGFYIIYPQREYNELGDRPVID